jgi:CheY-like chemotaxis protein
MTGVRAPTAIDRKGPWALVETFDFLRMMCVVGGTEDRAGPVLGALPPDLDENRTMDILIVDDDADTRTLLAAILDDLGTVHTVPDVYQALEHLTSQHVDVLVLDLLLPGANGVVLLDRLQRAGRSIPTIVVSGMSTDNGLSRLARAAGVCAILTKPFDNVLLRECVIAAAGDCAGSPTDLVVQPSQFGDGAAL